MELESAFPAAPLSISHFTSCAPIVGAGHGGVRESVCVLCVSVYPYLALSGETGIWRDERRVFRALHTTDGDKGEENRRAIVVAGLLASSIRPVHRVWST